MSTEDTRPPRRPVIAGPGRTDISNRICGQAEPAPANAAPPAALLSLDIDGTLEAGDPPGPLTLAVVRELQRYGLLIGSASDRTVSYQRAMWAAAGIVPAFLSHKHDLPANTAGLPATRRVHVGDTDVDAYYAGLAGFEFIHVTALPAGVTADWLARAVIAGEVA